TKVKGILPRAIKSLFIILVLSFQAVAAPPSEKVRAEILADTTAIVPGRAFNVGVLLAIEPQWHVYWMNPGDSGLPTTMKFDLPPGFAVSEVQYPVPTKFLQPGELIAYGYEGSVLLMAKVTPPKDLVAGGAVSIKALASWLVCQEVCIPGKAEL